MLIKFTRPLTVYQQSIEFTFRQGYSYECEIDDESGEMVVWNIDKSVEVRLSVGELDGLVE